METDYGKTLADRISRLERIQTRRLTSCFYRTPNIRLVVRICLVVRFRPASIRQELVEIRAYVDAESDGRAAKHYSANNRDVSWSVLFVLSRTINPLKFEEHCEKISATRQTTTFSVGD